ncbi:MAG TPA: helix-turn-helix domain-containing protein [Acidimicrobiales bacterium]|jgi:AcrR family transcriptional regulator|nr:helix-turn-helix domain-containing protein [Acidimicrobiales bacterium]
MPRVTDAYRESKRRQILDASIECFAREGFHRTSMAQIIAEAGVSAGTIYLYFDSKEQIVEAIAEERHALESVLAATALANPDTRQALHDLADGYLNWLSDPIEQKRRRVTVQVWAEALRSDRVASIVRDGVAQRQQIADFIRERQQQGHLVAGLDPDAVSRVMLSLVLGFVLQQAWDAAIDVDGYRSVLNEIIDRLLLAEPTRGRVDHGRPPKR